MKESREKREKGFIDQEKVERILKDHGLLMKKAGYYLCGPPILMDNSIKYLKTLGVSNKHIHYEKFSL